MRVQTQSRGIRRGERRNSFLAFTLVEILVVVAILGILAALLLPALARSKRRAQQIICVSNLHQLGVGLQNFLANNHGYPVVKGSGNGDEAGMWDEQLQRVGLNISATNSQFRTGGVWLCPSVQWAKKSDGQDKYSGNQSYCYNAFGVVLTTSFRGADEGGSGGWLGLAGHDGGPQSTNYMPIAESEVVVPSDMIAIGDSFTGFSIFTRDSAAVLEKRGNALSRHSGKGNVVFCDGHVESPTLKYLFEDTSDEALTRWNRDHQPHQIKL
jgi:prepilin-type processing-associated H-X9-DG protein/prepilin-type N-terminal cleavage/methylation domain-containing protein